MWSGQHYACPTSVSACVTLSNVSGKTRHVPQACTDVEHVVLSDATQASTDVEHVWCCPELRKQALMWNIPALAQNVKPLDFHD